MLSVLFLFDKFLHLQHFLIRWIHLLLTFLTLSFRWISICYSSTHLRKTFAVSDLQPANFGLLEVFQRLFSQVFSLFLQKVRKKNWRIWGSWLNDSQIPPLAFFSFFRNISKYLSSLSGNSSPQVAYTGWRNRSSS